MQHNKQECCAKYWNACIYVCAVHTYTHMHAQIYTHACLHAHACTHTHTHTHTHTLHHLTRACLICVVFLQIFFGLHPALRSYCHCHDRIRHQTWVERPPPLISSMQSLRKSSPKLGPGNNHFTYHSSLSL